MTDREKLIELLYRAHNAVTDKAIENHSTFGMSYSEQIQTEADHLIANGVTVQQWVPVTERLPEDDLPKDSKVKQIKVLVAYKTNGRWVTRTQIRAKGYWYGAPNEWSWVKTSDPITHWMPLSEPPKEG